jgi:hypothetical protein
MKLSLTAYKLSDGLWAFDHEHQNTIQELLCNGTEKVIDEYFEIDMNRPAKVGDQIYITLDTEEFDDCDTVLNFQSTNDQGTVYLDTLIYEFVWLCPWLQGYFGKKPENLYAMIEAVNPGKENFQRTIRTGINPLNKYLKPKRSDENIFGVS